MVNWEDYEGATGNDPTSDLDEKPDQGIYPKYVVFKHPKQEVEHFQAKAWIPQPGYENAWDIPTLELVDDFVFVLKPIKDKHARIAMAAYAESVKEEKPQLAKDLYEILGDF